MRTEEIMSDNNKKFVKGVPKLHLLLSTGFGIGFWPWGPGTLAGFVGLLIWAGLYFLLSPDALAIATAVLIVASLFIGVWTDNVMEKYWGEDPRGVVIDEFFGTWIAVTAALYCPTTESTLALATTGFVLFRIIDITKPLGCRWVDKNIHGGWGCMLDDALAGFYAVVLTLIIRWIFFG